jgi:drug/metabolite transporter (DMT)-like permease
MRDKNRGIILVLLSALMFGSYGVWSRLIGDAMGNFFQGWTRALIILVLILPLALWRREVIKIDKKDWGWLVVFLIFTSLTQAPIFYAFNHMDIGSATLLFFVSMFLTMNLIGIVFFRESFGFVKLLSTLLALIGMYFVFSFSINYFSILAAFMAILNGIASGGEVAFSKKLSARYSPLYLIVLSWVIILISNYIISVAVGEQQVAPSISISWAWQVCYSLTSLFAFWLVIAGFRHVQATIGALIGLLEIVFSVTFGTLIFHETLTLSIVTGGILIILAAALPNLSAGKSAMAKE